MEDEQKPGTSSVLFEERFDDPCLDRDKWLPNYLPHWSDLKRSAACYEIREGYLRLLVPDHPWCPEFDGDVKVSNLQTGHFSGPIGSPNGQHRFKDGLIVRSEVPELRLFLPRYCRLDMRARASLNPWNLAALWLIGFEDVPERSGEITLFEVFGHNVFEDGVKVGRGVKRIRDDRLRDEIDEGMVPIQLGDWHLYSMIWTASGIEFLVDDRTMTTTRQSPDYPMQLMLNLYDLPVGTRSSEGHEAFFDVDYIRATDVVPPRRAS